MSGLVVDDGHLIVAIVPSASWARRRQLEEVSVWGGGGISCVRRWDESLDHQARPIEPLQPEQIAPRCSSL